MTLSEWHVLSNWLCCFYHMFTLVLYFALGNVWYRLHTLFYYFEDSFFWYVCTSLQ